MLDLLHGAWSAVMDFDYWSEIGTVRSIRSSCRGSRCYSRC